MAKINKTQLPETSNSHGGQAEITDATNSQILKILPIKFKKGDLIGKEFPGIKGFITKVLGKKKVGPHNLTHVQTSDYKDFYLYPDGSPVYIKNTDGTNTKNLVPIKFQLVNFKGREIAQRSPSFYIDTFEIVNITGDVGGPYIHSFIEFKKLGTKNSMRVILSDGETGRRGAMLDQETGEILKVGGNPIKDIEENNIIKIKKKIIQKANLNPYLNRKRNKRIYVDTFQEVKIRGIEQNIKEIFWVNPNISDNYLGPYQIMFAETDEGKIYLFDVNTMKVLKFPGIDCSIDASLLKSFLQGSMSRIRGSDLNIFQEKIITIPISIPLRYNNIAIYEETGLPVKVPGKNWFVCGFYGAYTSDQAKIINGNRYGKACILDTKEEAYYGIYLREGDLSILEATLLNGEKVMINNILDEECRSLNINGKEVIAVAYDKYKKSMFVDKETFKEVIVKIPGTDEEINTNQKEYSIKDQNTNLIRHHVLNIGGEDIIQVGTKHGLNIYVYKKNLAPLQIPGINGYVEDISELGDGKWNMKVNGKWNLVRVN